MMNDDHVPLHIDGMAIFWTVFCCFSVEIRKVMLVEKCIIYSTEN